MEAGAHEIVQRNTVFDQASRLTGARIYKPMLGMEIPMGGFDRIYDTVGVSATLNLALRLLKTMGTLSVVGIGGNVRLDLTPLWLKLQTVKGVYAYGTVEDDKGRRKRVFKRALEMIAEGALHPEPLVTHRFAIDNYRDMIAVNLDKRTHEAMKTVVSFKP